MPRITPVKAAALIRVFELDGWTQRETSGGHTVLVKPGFHRPLVIPVHSRPCSRNVILSNLRTARMSRQRYFELLEQAK